MATEPFQVKFKNSKNPNSAFDLITIEEIMRRTDLNHDIEKLHRVEFFTLIFITAGAGFHTVDFTDYPIKKGTLLTIRKDQIQRFHRNDNLRGYLLLFLDEFLVSYLEKLEAQKSLQLFNELLGVPKIQLPQNDYFVIHEIVQRITEEYFTRMDDYSLGIIRSELHILITKLYRIKAKDSQVIFDKKYLAEFIIFQNLVENHVKSTNRVSDYAKMMTISTKTLNTISKSIVNKTAKEFIDEISIKQIKRLLINTSLSIKEIAYASGFEETTNFYKYFKRQLGMTPEQFRTTF
ncbi:MAG: helix-turn-helix transcriptional regulator [Saprospiraceae bacterium]